MKVNQGCVFEVSVGSKITSFYLLEVNRQQDGPSLSSVGVLAAGPLRFCVTQHRVLPFDPLFSTEQLLCGKETCCILSSWDHLGFVFHVQWTNVQIQMVHDVFVIF